MEGFNVTIFTYGQTASGKTFTMRGGGDQAPGIIPLALREIFTELYERHG
jgi:centromeric protein E